MSIVHRMAASSNFFLSTPLLKPTFSHFPKRLVSIPTCLYNNKNRAPLSTATTSCAVATDSSQIATLSQNDDVENNTQIEKTQKLVLPTNESSQKLLRIRHTVMYNPPFQLSAPVLVPIILWFFIVNGR